MARTATEATKLMPAANAVSRRLILGGVARKSARAASAISAGWRHVRSYAGTGAGSWFSNSSALTSDKH